MHAIQRALKSLVLACAIGQFAAEGWAQTYPVRPVRYIVPSSPGGGNDTMARVFAEELAQMLGQNIVVDNRAGAAGNIAAEMVARSPADGYTVLQLSQSLAVNVSLYRNLPYDLVRDFAAVTMMAIEPYIVVVHPSLPAKSIGDLIRLAQARPGTINYPSAGAGTTSFLSAEQFKSMAGVNIVHVPYKGGGPALISVVSGETTVYFGPVPPLLPHIQQGRLRALAVATAKRLPAMPEVPAVAESVPGFEFTNWYGLLVPAKTPRNIIATINRAAVAALDKPAVNKRLVAMGLIPMSSQPEEFADYIKLKIAALAKIIRDTGASVN